VGDAVDRLAQRRTGPQDEAAGQRACSCDGHLLPEHGTDRGLRRVDGPRDAQARRTRHQRLHPRVAGEVGVDSHRVSVQVEQPSAALHRDGQVAQVIEDHAHVDVGTGGVHGQHPTAVGQPQTAP
jgi:hypothetical protein